MGEVGQGSSGGVRAVTQGRKEGWQKASVGKSPVVSTSKSQVRSRDEAKGAWALVPPCPAAGLPAGSLGYHGAYGLKSKLSGTRGA